MSQARPLVHALSAGEISAATLARVDQEKARLWAETQENLFPFTIGKAMMRPGTTYLASAKTHANRVREIPFVKSLSAQAGIEMSSGLLRIHVDDELVAIESVTSTVTNGDFSSTTGWTLTTTGDATANINSTVSGALYMACPNRGGTASCTRSVSTSSSGTQHTLKIVVTRGPVTFRCGSTSGGDDYITETSLDTGTHFLSFTPTGSYHPYFSTRQEQGVVVDSIEVASAGTLEFTAPWTETELRQIQFTQSVDVMYLMHTNWQPRKIERRGDASWSLVLYKFGDGPTTAKNITITPGQAYGNTTLTASSAVFKSTDVGSIYRVGSQGFDQTFNIAGTGAATEAIRVRGIDAENTWTYAITGTWVGTIRIQISYDGPDTGWLNHGTPSTFTGNATASVNPGTDHDNITFWIRAVFQTYTSGTATVQLSIGSPSGGEGSGGAPGGPAGGTDGIFRVTAYTSETSVDVEVLDYPSLPRIGNVPSSRIAAAGRRLASSTTAGSCSFARTSSAPRRATTS
jgi:hypothetical protein